MYDLTSILKKKKNITYIWIKPQYPMTIIHWVVC